MFDIGISKKTVKAYFQIGTITRTWLNSLRDNQWDVIGFDAQSRIVTFIVVNHSTTIYMSLTLPKGGRPEYGIGRHMLEERRGKNNTLWS